MAEYVASLASILQDWMDSRGHKVFDIDNDTYLDDPYDSVHADEAGGSSHILDAKPKPRVDMTTASAPTRMSSSIPVENLAMSKPIKDMTTSELPKEAKLRVKPDPELQTNKEGEPIATVKKSNEVEVGAIGDELAITVTMIAMIVWIFEPLIVPTQASPTLPDISSNDSNDCMISATPTTTNEALAIAIEVCSSWQAAINIPSSLDSSDLIKPEI
ncbi:uncharacterized protein A4U43_C02F12300 [Asparagus officinalis]|uniref:Uncharacterized protein n=1 Tax=Asparagus officinalis TaxID=4686 RepID=A0A5P1FHW1_ASPOF|nr:uncharacterized protein A4U43_C02F12300 [Asparagus officinalis]